MDYNKYLLLIEFCTVVVVIGIGLWSARSADRGPKTRRRAPLLGYRGRSMRRDGQSLSPD
jgi:hypothetical protein